jgi:hypothetical protein
MISEISTGINSHLSYPMSYVCSSSICTSVGQSLNTFTFNCFKQQQMNELGTSVL